MSSAKASTLRRAIDWGDIGPLRLRARVVADGAYAGLHRSGLRGAGVEFGGYRAYAPGDDLRRLDRRSLLRHERLVVRQFEMETDRTLCLLLDASASMAYVGPGGRVSKVAFAALIGAALARVSLGAGDPVSLTLLGGDGARSIGPAGGLEQFERIVAALESLQCSGDEHTEPGLLDAALESLERVARRGAIVVSLTDLLDWPIATANRLGALAARGRVVVVAQILDPSEAEFPFEGPLRMRATEGDFVVETEGDLVREAYLERLAAMTETWREAGSRNGGRLLSAVTSESAVAVVRRVAEAAR